MLCVVLCVVLCLAAALIILDEPTSGLDSASAFGVMTCLRKLAAEGRTVVATIHQPSSEVLALLDKVCILSAGKPMYFGRCVCAYPKCVRPAQAHTAYGDVMPGHAPSHPVHPRCGFRSSPMCVCTDAPVSLCWRAHRTSDVTAYFEGIGHECPQFSNPSDFVLSLVNTDFPGHADVVELEAEYRRTQQPGVLVACGKMDRSKPEYDAVFAGAAAADDGGAHPASSSLSPYVKNVFQQFAVLMHRNSLNLLRNPGIIWIRLFMYTYDA